MLERYILDADNYVSSGGSVPIVLSGSGCIGTVTVSGLTQFEDNKLLPTPSAMF